MDAFKSWIVMGVGYLMPRALEAGVPSVPIHNVGEEKNGVFTPITTEIVKVALEDQCLNKKWFFLSSVFIVVVGEKGRKYDVVV